MLASYSKPGYPYDNAVTEVFFKYLKQGLTEREIERKTGINRTTFRRYRQKYNEVREDRKE